MRTEELDYPFDPALVATRPAEPRDAARMLVFDRSTGSTRHLRIRDLPSLLESGDSIVLNATRVVPARVRLERESTGGRFEGLVLPVDEEGLVPCYLRGAKRLRHGDLLALRDPEGAVLATFEVAGRSDERLLLRPRSGAGLEELLEVAGRAPLPPYILGARRDRDGSTGDDLEALDRHWYRTVYQKAGGQSSVAAPTAGLHFTEDLLERIGAMGVRRIEVELEVGPGTFKPVTSETIEDHPMHRERFLVDRAAQSLLVETRGEGGRIIAVGTTSCRVLESLPDPLPGATLETSTDLLIAPGHAFRYVDGLLTNFHLPRSTLLALVAGLVGLERMRALYAEAVERGYRFYSYGDAMLIL